MAKDASQAATAAAPLEPPPLPLAEVISLFKPVNRAAQPDDQRHAALAQACAQVEAMAGDRAAPQRFRLIDQRHDVPKDQRRGAIQLYGSLNNNEFCRDLWRLNDNERYDVYIVAQEASADLPADHAINSHDIVAGRVIVADFDGDAPDPALTCIYHSPPTFRLKRENDPGHAWLGWRVANVYDASKIPEVHKRVIQLYGSDPAVCDPARIIRLAGFWSHKRPEKTRYLFERGHGYDQPAALQKHLEKLPEIKRKPKPIQDGDGGDDYVSEARLCYLLKHVDPECSRIQWLAFLGAIRDAQIGRDDGTYMELSDKYELADAWSSGELGDYTPANYEGTEDVGDALETLHGKERAGIGSIVHAAKQAGMDTREYDRLRAAEPFKHPDNSVTNKGDKDKGEGYPEPFSAAELVAGDFPRAEYAWQDFLLAKHVNLLYGDGGTGKTLLAEHVAVALAAGLPLFGRETRQMPVLLVLAEDDAGETKGRLGAICQQLNIKLTDLPLHIWCLLGRDVTLASIADDGTRTDGPFMGPLRQKLGGLGPCLLVLDTVSDIATLDETKRLPVNTLCKVVLAGLCREFSTTILVNAHPSKAAMADGSGYSGSTAWNNAVRNRLTLERTSGEEKGPRRILKVAKANYGGEASQELHILGAVFTTRTEHEQKARDAEEREAVLETVVDLLDKGVQIVRSNGNGQKPADVALAVNGRHGLKLGKREVLQHLNALERDGELGYRPSSKERGARAGFYRPER